MSLTYHIARYKWLRAYYRDAHLQVALATCPIKNAQGTTVGFLEIAQLREGRLYLRGWVLAEQITFRLGDMYVQRRPQEEREDVAQALGCDKYVGFKASLPFVDAPLLIELLHGAETVSMSHDLQASRSLIRADRRLNRQFMRDILPLMPMIFFGVLRKDPDLPRQIKSALGLGLSPVEGMLDANFMASHEAAPAITDTSDPRPPMRACVILPVYNAFDLLSETLHRLEAHTDLPCDVIVIEDASPDPRVRPFLRSWASCDHGGLRITLLENDSNLGFIGSVNRGFDHALAHGEGPVILLNSDALVPAGWCRRLLAPLADPMVASATPMSNDAEIFGAPILCKPTDLSAGQADHIDAVLGKDVAPDAPRVTAPTGVGFCMALGRNWLTRLGGFDTIFGRGYGEEVDWCRRAAAAGGQHVAVPNLFVEHRGGASFGEEKLALVQAHNAIIATRYPGYDRVVQDFIRSDPLITPRLIAALAWADSLPDVTEIPVYIAHSMGGGAEHYLQDRVQARPASLVLRMGGATRCRIEFASPAGRMIATTEDLNLIVRLLASVAKRRIIYSCAVGDPDLVTLARFLAQLAQTAPLDLLFHDYLPLSPSYTLLDADGRYRGVPEPTRSDPAHHYRSVTGQELTLQDWRQLWGDVAAKASRLIAFSPASARIIAAAYPKLRDLIHIQPHKLLQTIPRLHQPTNPRKVIGVLGAIGPQKGAAVVSALSKAVAGRNDIGLALIGASRRAIRWARMCRCMALM
jgi:GT2 family glycosyltransferase